MDRSSEKELERIARLSGLTLSAEEKDILFADLSRIVPYMERISELDTSGAEDAPEDTDNEAHFREDTEKAPSLASEILDQAPQAKDGMFNVPRIV
ncbi:MAG: Asp-tRNA(Asn)/Glu-tRNA(Gln) amidotransferase subunit GatC [Clostridiales bacterium]|nr:Asp-tRNA(Asn)/Glu-tRNA(Gln) amidotransferase subunit GatC [Clostridiales bacterium]MBR5417699.1 Asp-tRNA(Asn)/Glu-tRNA(Gln) amidotransferase subunit GatC [Clostridiales bacterium]